MQTTPTCPPTELLRQFLHGHLPDREVDALAAHIEKCDQCVGAIQGIRDPDNLLEAMRKVTHAETDRQHPLVQTLIGQITAWENGSETTQSGGFGVVGGPHQETPGQYIGAYRLVERVGQGGMGTVWIAEQEHPVKRQVALKLIKPGMDSAQVIRRFEAERQALALMDHSNIAMVLDAGATQAGRPYFVMELVRGVPITRYCDQQRLSIAQRLELFLPLCYAIQHAHQKRMIHRDIKPSNVLVCQKDGKPMCKVIDFGVAKALQENLADDSMVTEFGVVIGTLEYMSPEQAAANALDIDTRCDVYSLGVLLYELLTGSTPLGRDRLRGMPMFEVLRLIREEEPPAPSVRLAQHCSHTRDGAGSPRSGERGYEPESLAGLAALRRTEPARLLRQVRGELDWIIMKALEKDRQRRYDTASSLARDIEHYLHGEPVEACPPSASYKLRKFLTKHKKPAIAVCLIAVLLVAGIIGTTWGLVAALRARDDADQQAAIARAVNDFLQKDLLSQADPVNQTLDRDPDIKVRTLLDRAASTIESKFAGQPLTEAAIRLTLGNAYVALGELAEARRHLERSLQLRLAERGGAHVDTLASKNSLAELLLYQGNYAQAEPLLLEAANGRARQLGNDHPDTLTSKHNLAALYYEQGKYSEAGVLFNQVMKASTIRLGRDHPDTLASMNGLALVYQELGQLEEAAPLLTNLLEASLTKLGKNHPHTLRSKSNLAMLYQKQRRYAQAEPLLQEVLQSRIAALGAGHPQTLNSKENVALLWEAKGQYEQAELLLKEVLVAREAALGADHPDTLRGKQNLAVMAHSQGRREQAETLLRDVVGGWEKKVGADHPDTLTGKSILARVLWTSKKLDEAGVLYREVLQARTEKFGAEHPQTLLSGQNLALFYREQGNLAAATELLTGCLAVRKKTSPNAWVTFSTQALLGAVLLDQKKHAEAEPLLRQGCLGMKQQEAQPSAESLESMQQLIRLYQEWDKPELEAEWRQNLAKAK